MNTYNYTALLIPLFFVVVWIENQFIKYDARKANPVMEASVANISIGMAERFIHLFTGILFYNFFLYMYTNYALYVIPNDWWVWVLLLLSADFVWYWYHRFGHTINILWAAHIVHHQSEYFNFTAAARITTFQAVIRYAFWGILPFIGFHPDMIISILLMHGAYSFFTHTEMLPSYSWLEYVFITPSLHGVHHASNEKYLDKNFGDVFVFWDKMFGTFQKEEEKPVYGLTHPLKSYSFLWQHFHYFMEIGEALRRKKKMKEKVTILFGGPEHMDQQIRPYLEAKFRSHSTTEVVSLKKVLKQYIRVQMLGCGLILTLTTFFFESLSGYEKGFGFGITLLTLINCGALMEQRHWIYYMEWIRLHFMVLGLCMYVHQPESYVLYALVLLLISYVISGKKRYTSYLFA